jgi:hypothetical protein
MGLASHLAARGHRRDRTSTCRPDTPECASGAGGVHARDPRPCWRQRWRVPGHAASPGRPYQTGGSGAALAADPAELLRRWPPSRARAACGRTDLGPSIEESRAGSRTRSTTISAAPPSATWRRWSPIRPTWSSREARPPAYTARRIDRLREIPQGQHRPTTSYPEAEKGQAERRRRMISYARQDSGRAAGGPPARRPKSILRPAPRDLGAGLLRQRGDRRRRAIAPPPRTAGSARRTSEDPDGRHGGGDRGLSQGLRRRPT